MLRPLPLLAPAVGWVAGVVAVRTAWLAASWLPWLALLLLILAFYRRLRVVSLVALIGMAWGGASLLWDADLVAVDPGWTQAPVRITADVRDVVRESGAVRLTLRHVRRGNGKALPGLAWLYLYGGAKNSAWPEPGDRIRAEAGWHLPRDHRNPGGFDFAAYCFDRHIDLIGSAGSGVRIVSHHASWVQQFRQGLREMLQPLPVSQAGVLEALLLGDRHGVPLSVSDAFAATGTAHLLAISGLHIGMAALWGSVLCWWLLTRREAWIVAIPVRGVSAAFGLLVAIAYASVAGWPLPTQRAALMLAGGVLAWWLRERTSSINVLLAALMLIVLWDAEAVGSASLWLSFVATLAILLWGDVGRSAGGRLRAWIVPLVWITLLATLATLPIVVQIFGRLPVYSLPANLLLVPLYSLFVLPLSLFAELLVLFGLPHAATVVAAWAGYGVEVGNQLLALMHAWPGGNMWVPAVPWMATVVYGSGMFLSAWLFYRQHPRRAAGCMVVIIAFYLVWIVPERTPDTAEFVAWDVGQGAASSLMLPDGKVMEVDVPGRPNSRFNGGTTVAAGLRMLGMVHADVLVLSHAQSDHMGGALRLIEQLRSVKALWLADVPLNHTDRRMRAIVDRVQASGGHVRWLARGDHMDMGHARIDVLWPPRGFSPANPNNGCLVLAVHLPNGARLLLPGDIEAPAEQGMLVSHPAHDDLLLMPHHGSRTSSTPAWVDATSPHVAIAQTGYHNRYGFPARQVVRRYRKQGAKVWNTASGAVVAIWPSSRLHIRQCDVGMEAKRYWALQWFKRFHG